MEYAGSILCAPFILIETEYYLCKELYLAGFLKTFISVQPLLARFFQGRHHKITWEYDECISLLLLLPFPLASSCLSDLTYFAFLPYCVLWLQFSVATFSKNTELDVSSWMDQAETCCTIANILFWYKVYSLFLYRIRMKLSAQREYSSKPLKPSIVKRILVFKR